MRRLLIVILLLSAHALLAQSPVIFFTDLDSGPNTGNSDTTFTTGNGAYVTIYGNFFGTSQGTSTVTWNGQSCLTVLPSTGGYTGWGMSHLWYQKIIVQIGLACTPGTGQFSVTVNGQSSSCANAAGCNFTVRTLGTSHIYFAKSGGNDSAAGAWTTPLATIRGCKNKLVAGDICYIGGGLYQNSGEDFNAILLPSQSGTAGNPIALGAYPGATPQPKIGCTHGQSACNFDNAMQYGLSNRNLGSPMSYWTVFGLKFSQGSGAAAFHITGGGGSAFDTSTNDRVIGNFLECPYYDDAAGCFETSEVVYVYYFGNEMTNTGVPTAPYSQKQAHGVYFSSDTNHVWAGFNSAHDDTICRAYQFHSSPLSGSTGQQQYDLHFYNNLIYNEHCSGVNFATVDASRGTVEAYNNVIHHVGTTVSSDGGGDFACLFMSQGFVNTGTGSQATPPTQAYNNTCFDAGAAGNDDCCGVHGAIGNVSPPNTYLTNNAFQQLSTELYLPAANKSTGMSGTNNSWYGLATAPSQFSSNKTTNPLFVSTTAGAVDLHLQQNSPLIGNGVASWSGGTAPTYDFEGKLRPSPPSIGAYEYSASSSGHTTLQGVTALHITVQ